MHKNLNDGFKVLQHNSMYTCEKPENYYNHKTSRSGNCNSCTTPFEIAAQ
jgi:hypothetical protein